MGAKRMHFFFGHRRFFLWILAGILVFSALGTGVVLAWAQTYDGRISPGVFIGSVQVGGLDPETARRRLNETVDAWILKGMEVTGEDGISKKVPFLRMGSTDSDVPLEWVSFQTDEAVETAVRVRRFSGHPLAEAWSLARGFLQKKRVPFPVYIQENRLQEAVRSVFVNEERSVRDAAFLSERGPDGSWDVRSVPSESGRVFEWDSFFVSVRQHLATVDFSSVPLRTAVQKPSIEEEDVIPLLTKVRQALSRAPYAFQWTGEDGTETVWNVSAEAMAKAVIPVRLGKSVFLTIDAEKFKGSLDEIAFVVDRPAVNARFRMEEGRVVEFISSQGGQVLDREQTIKAFVALVFETEARPVTPVAIVVQKVEPDVTVEDANDLGIKTALGTGTSNYRGSPANRIKNIRNGVRLLNGLLIAPGETFSLLKALQPFDADNGYLPELVIKGNSIVPETGGGLCRIGTTTFRAAMNSGLPIEQRQNHSLVVSYYNDPSNGNPGTDATIYDPSPDFRFVNDTGVPILFEALMVEETSQLRFTFWGMSDGRKGSYTPPELIRWIPTGPEQRVETEGLLPGEEKCQAAHPGADAKFTYVIERFDGSKEEKVFESHYRALPRLCLVGKAADESE